MDGYRSTISYCGEAHESAAAAFGELCRFNAVVRVVATDGTLFDAQLRAIAPDPETGQYVVEVAVLDGDDEPNPDDMRKLDIYEDIQRIEVY